jgi:hypothetical protein
MGIWNHQQPVTIAHVDPDFESWLTSSWITLLGYKPYHYAVVEAPELTMHLHQGLLAI